MFGWFKKEKPETRAIGSGFTADVMAARHAYITGTTGLAELTATVQSAVALWEGGLSLADVSGTDLLSRNVLALTARSLALRGESVWLIEEGGLVPASDWDLSTRFSKPSAYRLSLPEIGGGTTRTALAGEVLHFRIGVDQGSPWIGTSPLRRASLSAGLLHAVETALADVYQNAPLGSQIVPMPESPQSDLEAIGRGFAGRRGRVMLRESVMVTAAAGPAPQADWKPQQVTPDIKGMVPIEMIREARQSVLGVFGLLPAFDSQMLMGPMAREIQRHLAQWCLQPIAGLIAEEASDKLGEAVEIDVMRPLQAFDGGGRARALTGIVEAMAKAKEAVAGEPGFEPGLTESESVGLPLTYSPIRATHVGAGGGARWAPRMVRGVYIQPPLKCKSKF
jgi:hypothetical protein